MGNNSRELTKPSHESKEDEDEIIAMEALRLATSVAFPMVLKSALELGLIETIYGSGKGELLSLSEIISKLPCGAENPQAPAMLDRILRLLVCHSILRCQEVRDGEYVGRLYGAEPICRFLVKKSQAGTGSVGPLYLTFHDKVLMESWYHLKDAILEGGVPFEKAHGISFFEYTEKDKRFNTMFNEAMSNHTTILMLKLLKVYRGFEALNNLVDVGGGIGLTASIITKKYPNIKAICFDLPHVISSAPHCPGVNYVGGDMFVSVPKGDAIFMKSILHDWSDEHCLKILRNCCDALPEKGKVIIAELILDMGQRNNACSKMIADLDLTMLSLCNGGRERTLKEFEYLAEESGFFNCQVVCSAYNFALMEFHKR